MQIRIIISCSSRLHHSVRNQVKFKFMAAAAPSGELRQFVATLEYKRGRRWWWWVDDGGYIAFDLC